MKTNLVRILSTGFLSLLLLFCLAACGAEETTPVDPTPSEPAAAVELPDTPELKLNDDGTGTYADLVTAGNNNSLKALATVYFHYEGDTLTSVDSVRVIPVEGWTSIEQDTELDVEGIVYGEGKSWATVPFLYYASIGAGLEVYDGYVLVDLQYREG